MNNFAEYNPLKQLLIQAIRQAYLRLQEASRGETLYVFGLFHDAEMSYIYATANTEEGLQEYINSQMQRSIASAAELRVRVRWSPADWKYHLIGEDAFIEANAFLETYWDEGFTTFSGNPELLAYLYKDVLFELDKTGFFGDRVVNNLFLGIFEPTINPDSMLQMSSMFNPPLIHKHFTAEMKLLVTLFNKVT
jgi:hypothetical protein